MYERDQKPVELLNSLVGIINSRTEGCNYVAKEVEVDIFKVLFSRLSETGNLCRDGLIKEIQKLGAVPLNANLAPQECFCAWLDLVSAIGRKDHRAILDSFIFGENVVIRAYNEVLRAEEEINTQQQKLLNNQISMLKQDEEKVKNLLRVLDPHD